MYIHTQSMGVHYGQTHDDGFYTVCSNAQGGREGGIGSLAQSSPFARVSVFALSVTLSLVVGERRRAMVLPRLGTGRERGVHGG